MILPQAFYDEISVFSRIILCVSGGVDSTVIYLDFMDEGIDFELLWNNTGRSIKPSRKTLCTIFKESHKPFHITYPLDDQKMIWEKTKRAVQRIFDKEITKTKKNIPCCWYLKEKPAGQWYRKHTEPFDLIISGLAPYESHQRNIRLGEIRHRNTYLRFKKHEQRWFAYPLRDINKIQQYRVLKEYALQRIEVQNSACKNCPIIPLWEDYLINKPHRWTP